MAPSWAPGPVDRRTKELVYLTVLLHQPMRLLHGRAHGVGAQGGRYGRGDARAPGRAGRGFSAPERAAIRVCPRADAHGGRRTEPREALIAHFNDEQIVEITLIAAMANFTNRFNNGLDLLPE